ncbi:MAG: HEAT repeat domain-containing protein [Pedobacter sp.]|nr:MAG: HEAT repeat domain-containing protein [Pedobacter sp.]
MERDFFKQYVDEHRDAFESEALPPNMLGNILGNLKEREQLKAKKKMKLTYTWLAVACSLFLVAGAYLFISQDKNVIAGPKAQVASNTSNAIKQPIIHTQETKPKIKKEIVNKPQRTIAYHQKADPYKEIFKGLVDSSSVANRMDAIIKANALASLNNKLKIELCRTFSKDENDNVRLAALGILAKFSNDSYINGQLVESLSKQKDPVVQLELVKIMGSNSNPETTDKLIAMANNPFTVDAVKEQVYYALLTNK